MSAKQWERDEDAIRAEIRAVHAPLKIVLKTKNEGWLLRGWVEHHLRIVGPRGLVVFDNMSDDPEAVRYLDLIARTVPVYRFAAMHNSIHDSGQAFRGLYAALRASCDYHAFLDTDELLFWARPNGGYFDDRRVVGNILRTGQPVIPGIWAGDEPGQKRRFRLTFRKNCIVSGIRSGKPVLSSAVELATFQNHNCQLPPELLEGSAVGNVVIGHLNRLSPAQRVAANLEKLRSYARARAIPSGAGIGPGATLDQVLALDVGRLEGNARAYAREIQALAAGEASDPLAGVPAVTFQDGTMTFDDDRERREVLRFLRDPVQTIAAALQVQE